jgi:isoquinoline 1-oxidoreductase
VLVAGEPVQACQWQVADVAGRNVTTIEGLSTSGRLRPVQQAFVELGAAQCGYCTPAMILSVTALLAREPDPDDATIDDALAGNVCRCGTYPRIRRAVHRAAELMAQSKDSAESPAPPARDRWGPPDPRSPGRRPTRPWDMTEPEDRDWFEILGEGLVVALRPPASIPPASFTTGGGAWLSPGTWTIGVGAWLHVSAEGIVRAFTGKVDLGNDNCTALRLLVAEELHLPLAKVLLAQGDTDLCPYDVGTFASRSMLGAASALRQVAAHAYSLMPVSAGSRRVEIITDELHVTPATEWQLAGRPHVPSGISDVVTGARNFITDLTAPGVRYGAVLRPPVVGATLRRLDAAGVEDRRDVVLVRARNVTGVVADDPSTARSALASLRPEWDLPTTTSSHDLEAFLRSHSPTETDERNQPVHHEKGNPDEALENAAVRERATYTTAYIAPAALEARGALAIWETDERLTVWLGTQTPFLARTQIAAALALNEEQVRVIVPPAGGGFGGKQGAAVAIEAAILARQVGQPVKVSWSRHEEFTVGTLRPAAVIDVAGGATSSGELVAWTFTNINSGSHAIGSPYRVANQRFDYQPAISPLTQGSYRGLAANANNFARESMIDELAHALGLDPVEFRLRNLDDEQLATVLRTTAERFGWVSGRTGAGQGIACGVEKNGRVATAVEVVDVEGNLRITRIVTAYECGAVVNPDTVINQIEGATVMALGGALFEAIHFSDGVITNGSFSDYRVPRINDVPPIEVILVDRPDLPSAGAGETPMIAVAPAIANAIFDLTRHRLRSLPLSSDGSWFPGR